MPVDSASPHQLGSPPGAPGERAPGGPRRLSVEAIRGDGLLRRLGTDLDDLQRATGAPVTARRPWLQAWMDAYQPPDPWAIVVRDESTGRLDGAVLLCRAAHDAWDELSGLGRRDEDRAVLPARDTAAAEALTRGVAKWLASLGRPWTLRLEQLPSGDPVVAQMVESLDNARTLSGVPIPTFEFASVESVDAFVGKSMRRQLRRAAQRISAEGLEVEVSFDTEPDAIEQVLYGVERIHRGRDHDLRSASDLDCDMGRDFWWQAILQHAGRREVEIATLRLDGVLAAYVVSLLDPPSYRVFDGRFATSEGRFSPGRLVEYAVLERAFADERFERLDWMNGRAAEKLLAANALDTTEHLVACAADLLVDLDRLDDVVLDLDEVVESSASVDREAIRALAGMMQ